MKITPNTTSAALSSISRMLSFILVPQRSNKEPRLTFASRVGNGAISHLLNWDHGASIVVRTALRFSRCGKFGSYQEFICRRRGGAWGELLTPMYGPAVRRKSFRRSGFAVLHQCIRPLIGAVRCSGPSWISAHRRSD
jgi:hypothetical protein